MESHYVFITWTTYGTWLPGDARGWRKRQGGPQDGNATLERWCQQKMVSDAVLLDRHDRKTVEQACRDHCAFRGWTLLVVKAQSNHVHVVVESDESPKIIRDQLKANATRRLREQDPPLHCERTWTRGGDTELIAEEDLEQVVLYVTVAQDRKHRDEL